LRERKKEKVMENTQLVRIVCAVLAVVLLGAIVLRRKSKNAEE